MMGVGDAMGPDEESALRPARDTSRARAAAAGAVIALLGALGTLGLVAAGFTGAYLLQALAGVLPLVWVGLLAAAGAWFTYARPRRSIYWLGAIVVLGAVTGLAVVPMVVKGSIGLSSVVFRAYPAGLDFRDGLLTPAAAFSSDRSIWPPLTLLIGRVFLLFDAGTAYLVQVGVLLAFAVAAVLLGADVAAGAGGAGSAGDPAGPGTRSDLTRNLTAALTGFWLLTSAGMLFELERGNINLYALLFSVLSVWLMMRPRTSPWLAAAALAIAIGLKVYPAILVVPMVWRYRARCVVPLTVTIAAVMLVAGPYNAVVFALNQIYLKAVPFLWAGNHSAQGFAWSLWDTTGFVEPWVPWTFMAASLGLWLATMWRSMRAGWSERSAAIAAAACFPVMCVIPALSHDYKLTLLVFPLAVLTAAVVEGPHPGSGAGRWGFLLAGTALAFVMLSRSTLLVWPSVLANKFPMIVLLQVALLVLAWSLSVRTEGDAAPAPS